MTNRRMFLVMLFSAVFRRRSRAAMAVIASIVGAATLFCLAAVCIAVPQQMNEDMRSYGANLIVTPAAAVGDSAADHGSGAAQTLQPSNTGINAAVADKVSAKATAAAAARSASYRYENVRINAAPYVMAGIDPAATKALNRHWDVEGRWPSAGNVMLGRDAADALGVSVGSYVTIGYRAGDNGASGAPGGGSSNSSGNDATDGASTQPSESSSASSSSASAQPTASPDSQSSTSASSPQQPQSGQQGSSSSSSTDDMSGMDHSVHNHGSSDANTGTANNGVNGRVSTDILNIKGTQFRVSGIVSTGGSEDDIVYAKATDLTALTKVSRGTDVIEYSSNASGNELASIVKSINRDTALGVTAQQVTRITSSNRRIIAMLQTLFWIVSIVVLVLTLVGVGTTISSIISQRRNEIGLRKALGASSRGVGAEFHAESALYGLLGGLIGTGIGYGFARVLGLTVFHRVIGFDWALGTVSVALSMLVAVAASIPPVRRATRIDPAVVLREE
ncbi:MAG: FtsX-like permease family protein [Bifidobacterium sp.]|nr:FtsX-like permease family protein [Bifidobacterium sp.]